MVVVYNEARDSRTFQVRAGLNAFRYTLPGMAGATFTWSGAPGGSYTADAHAEIRAFSLHVRLGSADGNLHRHARRLQPGVCR